MDYEKKFEIDDIVWAKIKDLPPWPGRVTKPTKLPGSMRKESRYISFFGNGHYAWVEIGCLRPYFPFRDAFTYGSQTPQFKEACRACEEFYKSRNPDYVAAQKNIRLFGSNIRN